MRSANQKQIIVSVTNDLVADNRVHKVCTTLTNMGFKVLLAGRKLPHSPGLEGRLYSTVRFRLLFKTGPLFYLFYNFRLFLFLLKSRFDVLLSNDLDTLPANFLASRIKHKPLIYDSHEYFTEVPELVNRPKIKKIWEYLEKLMVPHVNAASTVCDSIAKIYTGKYGIPFRVIRNFPVATGRIAVDEIDEKVKIILYQGAVNTGRGLESAILAMKYLDEYKLVIAGDGDKRKDLERLCAELNLSGRVQFLGKLSVEKLSELTPIASVGLSIEEDLGLNYHYTLPNKLFDYIQAQVPVLVTDLPEMASIVRKYRIGEVIADIRPESLAFVLREMINNNEKRKLWKKNLEVVSKIFIWENEEHVVQQIFSPYL